MGDEQLIAEYQATRKDVIQSHIKQLNEWIIETNGWIKTTVKYFFVFLGLWLVGIGGMAWSLWVIKDDVKWIPFAVNLVPFIRVSLYLKENVEMLYSCIHHRKVVREILHEWEKLDVS